MEADTASLVTALLACQSRADLRQLRGMVSPSFPFITLACKHNRADLLHFLLEDDTSSSSDGAIVADTRWCSVEQEYEGHDAVYYSIRSSNMELLRTLLGSVTPELSERLVSESYEELLLNNVLLSEDMHLFVQYTLHDLRFFSKDDGAFPVTSSINNDIQERIQLLVENVAQINTYKKVGSHFLYTAKFIAQNIHILKQQLKSTYDRLPWEEMEFCLVSFVTAHIRQEELNIFYLSVLRKDRLLKELDKFVFDLQELKEHIRSTDIQNLRKPIQLGREGVASTISISYPHLYADYKEVRDISSLHIMKTYLDAALLVDPATRVGQLTIKRALQVTGEHLKNTLDSPKLSPAVSELLLLSAPYETKTVLQDVRNSLSHPHFESEDSVQYSNIQNDIKKIAFVISDVTFFNKVDKIKCMLTRLVNCESVEKFKKVANIFRKIYFVDVIKTDTLTKDHREIEDLIRNIEDQTPYEKKLFVEIKVILDKTKLQRHLTVYDYSYLNTIPHIFTILQQNQSIRNVGIFMSWIKFTTNTALKRFPSQKHPLERNKSLLLSSLLSKFYNSVSTRIKPEIAFGIQFAIARINVSGSIDGNINSIDEYSRKILEKLKKNYKVKSSKQRNEIVNGEQLALKIIELRGIIGTDRMCGQLYEHLSLLYKDETVNRFVIETLVLDTMTLLDSSKCVPNNVLYLDGAMPLLGGKCLRNHLAHGNALVDILPTGAWSAVLLNAVKLSDSRDLSLNCKIGNSLKQDINQLRRKFERGLSILDKQKKMWKSLIDGNFGKFASGIAGGADIYSRKEDLCSSVHYAARGRNTEILKFLTNQGMISTEGMDVNGQTALHVAAAFGRDVTLEFLATEIGIAINQVDGAGKTPLHLASQNGHKKTVIKILSLGAKIFVKDSLGNSPLYYAVMNNNLDVVKILWEKEATMDEHIRDRFTCLNAATGFGDVEMVQYLLQNKTDINAMASLSLFPLHLAIFKGNLEVVNLLLEKGARVNLRNSQNLSPLHYAVFNSHEEIVEILLKKGALVENEDYRTIITPLQIAVYEGNSIIVNLLLKHNANVNARGISGNTPLFFAAFGGHTDIVDLLLQNRALVNSRNVEGFTALHFAILSGFTSIVELLIQWGIGIHTQNVNKITPLLLATTKGNLQMVEILLNAKADVHACYGGLTALHVSAVKGFVAISEALIKKGAKVNLKKDISPLHLAATNVGNEKTVNILLENGANVDHIFRTKNNCLTALHIASFAGHGSMVEALLQGKADVDAVVVGGMTALHLAAINNHKAAVEILLKYEADVNHLDSSGFSALFWAARNNNKDLLDILMKAGADVYGGQILFNAIQAGHRLVVEALLKNKDIDINIKDRNGSNLLYAAAIGGNVLIARALIDRGIKIEDCKQNYSPLFIGIKCGHTEFVEVLLENGADINPTDSNSSPLFPAVVMNKPDILERLLHWGAKSNIKGSNNWTPLGLAVAKAQMLNTSILLQQEGVKINEKGNKNYTLLHFAAHAGNLEVVKLLVERGANKNAITVDGHKPIQIAAGKGHNNILAFFLDLGMSVDIRGPGGYTLMHYAAGEGQLAVVQYLMGKDVDINSTDLNGLKPIHYSAQRGHTKMVKFLLQSGAMYNARDKFGRSPSHMTNSRDIKELCKSIGKLFKALKHNDVFMVESLVKDLENYLDVKSSDNATLLHIASCKGFQQVCDILLKSKANPNIVGKGGNAPLHYAAKYSHPEIVESLLKNGAVHNRKSDNIKTPLDFATQKDVKSLLQRVALCFKKVQNDDVTVIEDITKIMEIEIIKAVMKARDADGNTLVVAAMKNGFPSTNELKQISQPNTPHILRSVESKCSCEKFTEAMDILKLLLGERIELLGEDNPGTLDIRYEIALILYKQRKYSEAEATLEDIYRKRVKVFGPHHADAQETRVFLAGLLNKRGKSEEAWEILQEIMSRQQEVLDEEHVLLMQTKVQAGITLQILGKYEEALNLFTQVYKIYKKKIDAQCIECLDLQNNIAGVLQAQGKHNEAFGLYQTIYEANKIILKPNHSDTLKARRNMATVLMSQHKPDEALKIFREILFFQKAELGPNHEDTVDTRFLMTCLHIDQNNLLDALKVHKAGLDARNENFDLYRYEYVELGGILDQVDEYLTSVFNIDIGFIPPCDFIFLKAAREGNRNEVNRLIENGSNVNTVDEEGKTALHFAPTVEVIELLLDRGADPTAVSQKGNTPLHETTSRGCKKTTRLLLQNVKRSKPNAFHGFINAETVVEGSTALHIAAKKGATNIVSCLLEHGACYNSHDRSNNRTPLQCSCSPSVTRLLSLAEKVFKMAMRGGTVLPQGKKRHLVAVLNSRDSENRTPLQLALDNGYRATARLFAGLLQKH